MPRTRVGRSLVSLLILFFAPSLLVAEAPGPALQPADVGLSAERLERIRSVFQQEIDDGEMVGAVALLSRRGEVAYFEALGELDREAGVPMRRDAISRDRSATRAPRGRQRPSAGAASTTRSSGSILGRISSPSS